MADTQTLTRPYVLLFAHDQGTTRLGADYLEKRISWWHWIAEVGHHDSYRTRPAITPAPVLESRRDEACRDFYGPAERSTYARAVLGDLKRQDAPHQWWRLPSLDQSLP